MIQLKFPFTNGGQETGFNHSGIETFLGKPLYYIARECGQNVGDVPLKEGDIVELHFEVIDLPTKDIPCAEELAQAFKASHDFTSDPKGKSFFKGAIERIFKSTVKILKVSDYGTTGLLGLDDDRDGGWYGLIRSSGVTNKQGNEGGGFGIGKYAAFAGSGFRTVIYSTFTKDNTYGFQGVSHLVSHKSGKHITQGSGYIGLYDNDKMQFSAIRNKDDIPSAFRRDRCGLDIYILDFLCDENWQDQLMRSVLENFWPALFLNKIRFKVGDIVVDKSSLNTLMSRFAADADFDAYYHYQSVNSEERKEFVTTLKHLGDVKLYLVKGWNDSFPKSIARVRTPGMVIDKRKSSSRIPYAGLFICDNEKGNLLLKKLEPPRHDEFQPQRSPGNGKAALDELNTWLAKCVQDLNPVLSSKTLDIPELHRFLPDTSDQDDSLDESDTSTQSDESFDKSVKLTPPVVLASKQLVVHSVKIDSTGDSGVGGSGGGGFKGGPKPVNPENGGRGDEEGEGEGENEGSGGGDKNKGSNCYISVQTRTIATGSAEFPICLFLRTNQDFDGSLVLTAVGDDGRHSPIQISKASLNKEGGKPLEILEGTELAGIQISEKQLTKVWLAVKHNHRVAIKVSGRYKKTGRNK